MPLSHALNKTLNFAQSLYHDFQEFLSPSTCLCCKQDHELDGALLCSECVTALAVKNIGAGPVCPFCGRPHGAGTPCSRCRSEKRMALYYWGFYADQLQECLLQFKFHAAVPLGQWLSTMTVNALQERISAPRYDLILPVPLHKGRQRERRYNQSEVLAVQFAKMLAIPYRNDILIRVKSTQQQAKLEEEDRWRNVLNAFAISPKYTEPLTGRRVLLVDDIVTTGATIYEAARPLIKAGVLNVDILSIAYAK